MSVGINRRDDLNKTPVAAHARLGDAIGSVVAVYDFTKKGGAVGTINLGVPIPKNAIIKKVLIDTIIQPTSGGSATVAFGVAGVSNTNLLGATAKASLTVGFTDGVPDGTAAHVIKLAAEANLTMTIGTAALTAGKIAIIVDFAESTDSASGAIVD